MPTKVFRKAYTKHEIVKSSSHQSKHSLLSSLSSSSPRKCNTTAFKKTDDVLVENVNNKKFIIEEIVKAHQDNGDIGNNCLLYGDDSDESDNGDEGDDDYDGDEIDSHSDNDDNNDCSTDALMEVLHITCQIGDQLEMNEVQGRLSVFDDYFFLVAGRNYNNDGNVDDDLISSEISLSQQHVNNNNNSSINNNNINNNMKSYTTTNLNGFSSNHVLLGGSGDETSPSMVNFLTQLENDEEKEELRKRTSYFEKFFLALK